MRYWFDTEFIDNGRSIDLLSIGIVSEDGRELYLELLEADWSKACPWVKENVLPHLGKGPTVGREEAKLRVLEFIRGEAPEIWGYFGAYDWVALCQLCGGRMIDMPPRFPMFVRDVKQWCAAVGNPRLPDQESGHHHALSDARWTRDAWQFLLKNYGAGQLG